MELNIYLTDNRLNTELENLKKAFNAYSALSMKYENVAELQIIFSRANTVLETLKNKFDKTQEEFFTKALFTNLSNHITNMNNTITNYYNTKNNSYLSQANTNIDNIISSMSSLTFDDKETISNSLSLTVGNYKKSLTKLEQKIPENEQNIENLNKRIEQLKTVITKQQEIIEGFSSKFNDNQLSRDKLFTEKITEFNNTNADNQETIKADWRNSKNNIQNEWSGIIKDIDKHVVEKKEEWTKIIENYDIDFDELKKNLINNSEETLNEIKQRRKEIEQLYGIVGKTVSCGEFKKYADGETVMIWVLYGVAFAIMFGVSIFTAILIYLDYTKNHSLNWLDILARMPITFILYAPALYLAMEAKKRHNHQMELRDFEIKISSIDPYLKNIDFVESEKEKNMTSDKITARDIKLELAKEFFARKKQDKKNENIIIPKEFIDLVGQLTKICNFNNNNSK